MLDAFGLETQITLNYFKNSSTQFVSSKNYNSFDFHSFKKYTNCCGYDINILVKLTLWANIF